MVFSRLWKRASREHRQARSPIRRSKRRLDFDWLEDRVVPTLMISLQEAGVNGGAPTVVGTASDFSAVSFTGTYGDFTLRIYGGSSDNGATLSDLLSSSTSIQNNSGTTATLTLTVFQDNFTLPSGTPLNVESGLGGTVNLGTLSYNNIFQAYASSTNNTTFDYTNGPQTAVPNNASFDTGSAAGSFTRTAGQPYALSSTVTINLSGGGQVNYSDHVNVTASATPPVTIGDFVWNDANANGIQNASEAGIPGVTLTLTGTDSNNNAVTDHATTDSTGHYLFTEAPGTYTVTVDASNFTGTGALVGYIASPTLQGSDRGVDSNPNPSGTTPNSLPGGSSDLTLDFGYYKNVTIGDFVWNDVNGNGIQNSGEAGIPGVTLTLTGTNGSGQSVTDHATTDSTGHYLFTEAPGTYTVTVDSSNFTGSGALVGYSAAPTLQGSDRSIDSNPSPSGTTPGALPGGSSDLTLDFGYYKPVKICGTVFCDTNLNGKLDSGEPLESGAKVTLTGTTGSGTTITPQTATTDANGNYTFPGLAPGSYTVKLTTASSGHAAEVSHGAVVIPSGLSATLTSSGSSTGNNFAEIDYASISGLVFLDADGNGSFNTGDSGVPGASVKITGKDYTGASVSSTVTTLSNGTFSITGLLPSDATGYTITAPSGGGVLGTTTPGTINGVTVGTGAANDTSDTITKIVVPGCNNDGINYQFGELINQHLTGTIGFWRNNNGQALLNSFGTTSSDGSAKLLNGTVVKGLTLANWLAQSMPNLFGSNAPKLTKDSSGNITNTQGANLTGATNSQVASYFVSLFSVQGQKSYAQVLATAFSVFTTTNSLNTGNITVNKTTSSALAKKYGFSVSTNGSGAATYTVPSADWAAFGITSSSGATKTLAQLLLLANQYAVKGVLNNGSSTLITETNDVFNAINNIYDIVG